MRIWIDLANSPQVLVFRPILAELKRVGHSVEVTTRSYAQTVQLADRLGLRHTVVGEHGGRKLSALVLRNAGRVIELRRWARRRHFDLALSHNSYSQVVAARLLGIPAVTMMDYEHQPLNHICFRLASRVIVPESFPENLLKRYGASGKVVRYPGVKEEIYLADFVPEPNFRKRERLPEDRSLVVIRPPAPWTAYHRFQNDLFDDVLKRLASDASLHLLFLPRISSQADTARQVPALHVATKVYDGPNLLYHADAAISGGGTMNREAAVLGTPAFTVFKGKSSAVDRYLINHGRLMQLQARRDLDKVHIERQQAKRTILSDGRGLVKFVTESILSTA